MPLSDAILGAVRAVARVGGVTVNLVHGEAVTTGVRAIPGRTTAVYEDLQGTTFETRSRDYLIEVADFAFGGTPVEPSKGMRIQETDGGVLYTMEIQPFANEPEDRWADPYRKVWRIHTKQIDRQTVG